ncbi:dihydrofolate reductase [Cellulomonas sp. JZ18]|uniref:dihydrofolate reductase family protein n=1 Tax=Cellulomonas sp. JZ18 TaxID=2654191 RepID=UPI0012D4B69A|nr:dihydrofolate reductase family protein [Cellulomonas sp. JZ18]QGQ20144.1 dihydrofolate reductase [Cellulomonas sp. JZ18]
MASVVSTLFVSLDGVAEIDPDWHFPYFDEHMGAAVDEDYAGADVLLLGRRTYESFAGAWPEREAAGGEDAPFAAQLGDTRKLVATHGDQDLGWRNVERVEGDLVEAVRALRADSGVRTVLVPGSLSVVRQLLAGGVLDELRLLVHPVLAQKGEKLFTDEGPVVPLTLRDSQAYPTGVVRLVYTAATRAPAAAGYEDVTAHVPGAGGS